MSYFGLTGGIACGKSTVAQYLRELGAEVIDADRVGHELVQPGLPAYRQLVEVFGRNILSPTGTLERNRLGAIVFANPDKLRQLNAILHPRIIARVEELAGRASEANPRAVVVVDAALIFEAGIGGRFHKVIIAWCRREQQLERLMTKTGLSRFEAEQRIDSQMSADDKRRRADFVVDCSGTLEETRAQIGALYAKLLELITKARTL